MFGVLEVRQGNATLGAHNAGHAGKALADGLHRFRRAAAGVGKPQFACLLYTSLSPAARQFAARARAYAASLRQK